MLTLNTIHTMLQLQSACIDHIEARIRKASEKPKANRLFIKKLWAEHAALHRDQMQLLDQYRKLEPKGTW